MGVRSLEQIQNVFTFSVISSFNHQDIDPDVMEELLRFIYTSKVQDITNIAKVCRESIDIVRHGPHHPIALIHDEVLTILSPIQALLAAADKYALESLKVVCESTLIGQMTVEDVASILVLSDLHR